MSDPPASPPGISFTPKEVGEHVVSVRKSGKHVTNSPFKILVGPSEIGDASKVRVWGKGLSEGQTFQVAEFIVDTRNAGAFKRQLSCPRVSVSPLLPGPKRPASGTLPDSLPLTLWVMPGSPSPPAEPFVSVVMTQFGCLWWREPAV